MFEEMRLILTLLKYTPFVLTAMMIAHCAMLLRGIHAEALNQATLSPLTYALYMALSVKMRFCVYHRIALSYVFAMYMCIVAQDYGVFTAIGIDVQSARLVMLTVGVSVLESYITKRMYDRKGRTGRLACGDCRGR